MKKLRIVLICLIAIVCGMAIFFWEYIKPFKLNISWTSPSQSEETNLSYGFIESKMKSKENGIYTNYIDKSSVGDETKGHDTLSESEGLAMLIYLQKNDKNKFDEHFNIVKNKMLLENHLVSWRISSKDGSKNKTSATIDDLRIVKACLLAYDRWGDFRYRKQAITLSKAIQKLSISNGILINFNDSYGKSKSLDLAYIDLYTFKILGKLDSSWNEVFNKNEELLKKGYISDKLPLYRKNYNLENNSFSQEKEVETLYSMLVAYHMQEASKDMSGYINWMKKTLNEYGNIYSKYSVADGKPTEFIESTAIYSIGLMIAKEAKDQELINKFNDKLKMYQVKDKNSEIYGAFGNTVTKDVYSFDNLEALLSLLK